MALRKCGLIRITVSPDATLIFVNNKLSKLSKLSKLLRQFVKATTDFFDLKYNILFFFKLAKVKILLRQSANRYYNYFSNFK